MKIKTEDLDAVMSAEENKPYTVTDNDTNRKTRTRPAKRWAGALNTIRELPEITGVITPAKGLFIIHYKTPKGEGTVHLSEVPESLFAHVVYAIRQVKGGARWI